MVTILDEKLLGNGTRKAVCIGLSSDVKPTAGFANGSRFYEMNTSTLYYYDEENDTWRACDTGNRSVELSGDMGFSDDGNANVTIG